MLINKNTTSLQTIGLLLLVTLMLCTNSLKAQEKWDMPMAYSASNFHTELGEKFSKLIEERTKGKLLIQVHAGGSLFPGGEIFTSVRRGLAPIGERLISGLSNDDPFYSVDSIPFLVSSYEDAQALYYVSKPTLIKKLDDSGLVFLYATPWPPQGLYSIKAANSKKDLAGLKFRAYSATTSRLAELLDMTPTTIEAAEISQAFATGVAQSMVTSGATGYDRKLWEHVKYYYDVQAWIPKNMVFVNKKAWLKLSNSVKQIILNTATEIEEEGWEKSANLASWYIEQFKEKGMVVEAPSKELKSDFEEVGQTLKKEWLEQTGEEGKFIIDKYLAKRK